MPVVYGVKGDYEGCIGLAGAWTCTEILQQTPLHQKTGWK